MSPPVPTRRSKILGGHNGPVHALTYSSLNAQYVLTGCSDRLIRLYNPSHNGDTLKPVQTYQGHGYEVLDLSVSADNAHFASSGGDKALYLWDVATAQILRRLNGHSGRVECVRWAGEGDSLLVSGSFDATVKIWDVKSQSHKPLMSLTEAKDSVSCLGVVGCEVFAGSIDGRLRVYDIRMGQCYVDVIGQSITSLTPTGDGQSVLVSSLDSTLRLMDRTTGKLLQAYKAPSFVNKEFRVRSTLGANDNHVVSGSEDGSIVVWDLLEGTVKQELRHSESITQNVGRGRKEVVSTVAWCPTRNEWCSAGGDGKPIQDSAINLHTDIDLGNVIVWST